jgi:hypothetical protein
VCVDETTVAVGKLYYIFVCVCVHACLGACVRGCGCVRERAWAYACACAGLLIQHETRMRHIVCVLSPPHFSTLSHKRHDLRKELLNIKCVLFYVQLLFETFLILSRIRRDIVVNLEKLSCKVPIIYVWWILIKLDFSRQIFEKSSYVKFHETPSSGSRVFPCWRTDRRIDKRT